MKLTREQIKEGLEQLPIKAVLNKGRAKELTPKQKRFVTEHVIKGETKSNAYRKAYNTKANPRAVGADAARLAAKPVVALEIERVKAAMEAAEYRSAGHLRALVVDSLTRVLLDDDARHSDRIQASKVIGEIAGVDLFKPITESSKPVSSKVARDQILDEIRKLMGVKVDSDIVDVQARSLLDELTGDPHPGGTPQDAQQESQNFPHSIPHKQPPENLHSRTVLEYPTEGPPL